MKNGELIVIEGIDGSGKGTQFDLLVKRLRGENLPIETADFPRYGNPSALMVERYLRGEYGQLDEVPPKKASEFYAADRAAAAPEMRKQLLRGHVVTNRYTTSNMGHQGAKFSNPQDLDEFLEWLDRYEFVEHGIPRPTHVFFLYVEPAVAQKLVDQKKKRDYTQGKKRDIHEGDINHLRKASETYLYIAKKFGWTIINCMKGDEIMSVEEIHELVYAKAKEAIDKHS